MKKWIIVSIIVVVIGGATGWFLMNGKDQATNAAEQVQMATVQKGELKVEVTGSGTITATTDQDVTAVNTILVVDSVSVSAGDAVDKGDTLITFKNGDVVTAPYDGEIASVSVKSGSGASQGKILLRMENEDEIISPITRGVNSDTNVEAGSLIVDTVYVKEGESVTKGETLAGFTDGSILKSPATGTIKDFSIASGDSIQSSAAVAHITDYNILQTTISVDELDVAKVKADQTVKVAANAFEDETFEGKVTKVAAEGTSTNGVTTFEVTIQLTTPKNLKIGMSTEASILIESKENALYVPVEAVYTRGNEKYVLDQSGEKVTVETGISNDTYVEITKGLEEGASIQIQRVKSSSNSSQEGMMMPGGNFPGGDFGGRNGGGTPPSMPSGGQGGK
ncbi:efflux RND transporter periplasmic adaptor subunit [Metabacillus fastidiosus]|uniref:efflux RND transporter periplasmic adaptor subunit n=1 Tax=Metabacillus fastidiosus TaxID=1458 RepID=UPI003D2A47D2